MLDIVEQERKKAERRLASTGIRVLVCAGTGCVANGSLEVIKKFEEFGLNVEKLPEHKDFTTVKTGCHGFCEKGVLVVIPDLDVTYVKVKKKTLKK